MYSLSEAIALRHEGMLKDDTFDVLAVVTSSCYSEDTSKNNYSYRRLGLADSQAHAVLRVSSTHSSLLPTEGSVLCLYGVMMKKVAQGIELRQDGRKHEGPLWHVLLPHNATAEQRRQNKQAANLWTWWQQQSKHELTLPKFVNRTLAEVAVTAGLKGHVVAHVCQVQRTPFKQFNKRKPYTRKMPHVTALLSDSSRTTFVSLSDTTGSHFVKLERAQRTQQPIRLTFLKSAFTNGEEIILVTTNETRITTAQESTLPCFSPESPVLSSSSQARTIISPLYRINGSRIVPHLPVGQEVRLEIENESVLATYFTVHNVLSCGGDILILQALMNEAIPLRWLIDANGTLLQVSLVGFPLSIQTDDSNTVMVSSTPG